MNRRQVLASSALCGAVALAGCSELVHRVRGANTPVSITVSTAQGESHRVDIRVERDGERVFEGTAAFDAGGNLTGVEGDDYREAAFERAGEYTVVAETAAGRDETSTEFSWRDLADCNDRFVDVSLDEESVQVSFWQTDMGCSGLDRL